MARMRPEKAIPITLSQHKVAPHKVALTPFSNFFTAKGRTGMVRPSKIKEHCKGWISPKTYTLLGQKNPNPKCKN